MALGMLVDGKWVSERNQEDREGRFVRPNTTFRNGITADGSSGFKAEAGRYHLYVSLACPWAHRTLIMRGLKGLERAIDVSIVDPYMGEEGWFFSNAPGCIPDTVNDATYLREIYLKAEPSYTGRVTVPVLWDKETGTIVNNESREIIRMLDTQFNAIASNDAMFYSDASHDAIEGAIDKIYQPINNGVYRAGFATTQTAYEDAVTELFENLDRWEEVLSQQPYLCGDRMTEADICMFTTLLRFDAVYYGHFKCNLRHIWDYPNLWKYLKSIYQIPAVKATCDFDHIKQHYYKSHDKINPTGIVPYGPVLDLDS
ncbi:Glutathione S-transferase omega [Geitlerinema sp. FC II]|nr:Glutathione S-transferase omega [Geitlerinema sp. FC II]